MGVDISLTGIPDFDKLEVVKSGVFTLTLPAGNYYAEGRVAHNLGYFPISMVYAKIPYFSSILTSDTVFSFTTPFSYLNSDGFAMLNFYSTVTGTGIDFNIQVTNPATGGSFYGIQFVVPFQYYLMRRVGNS